MEIYPMLTGSQLRQYLHISTRKLKYLMDHDYIPHEDTGQATYRYRVRWEDAVEFKRRDGGGARLSWGAGGAVQLPPSAQAQAQAGAGFPAHAGELPTFPTVAGPALGKRAGRPAHPASSPAAGPQPPDPPPLDKGGPPPDSAGGTEPAVQQGRAPRFFGHAGESAGVPGAGGGVFGRNAISIVRNRGRRPTAEGGSCWLFPFAEHAI